MATMIRLLLLAFSIVVDVPARADQSTLVTPGAPLTMAGLATFLNNAHATIATNYSGATPPAVCVGGAPCAYQFWLDTSTSPRVLRIYDSSTWVGVGSLDTSAHTFTMTQGQTPGTQTGVSYTAVDANRGDLIRFTNSGAVAVTQPQASTGSPVGFVSGWYVDYRNAGTGTVTITPTISTIDGAASLVLPPGRSVRIVSDGTNYFSGQTVGTPTTAVLGGVFSKAAITSNWLRSLGTDGVFAASQPAFTDISGVAAATQGGTGMSTYAAGDTIYASGANVLSALIGNTTTTRKFMRQTGTGSESQAPTWDTIIAADIPGSALTKTDDTNVTLTLGGSAGTALLNAASVTVGWTGTLAAGRLNSNVVQAVTAETNIGGSVTAQNLTFAWVGTLANARLATMATNTIKGNSTSGTASPADLAIGTCSTSASALIWTTNTGFGCNTAIAAPASALTGSTLASGVTASSLTSVGTLTGGATGAGFTVALTVSTVSGTLPCANTPAYTGDVTKASGSCATVVANIPTGATMAGSILATSTAAPGTPAAGKVLIFADSTSKRLRDIDDAGVLGSTVVADAGAANNFLTAISTAGVISKAQPAFSNLSGSVAATQMPALTGDVTTSAGAVATTISANAVTYAKFQQVAAVSLVGNATGGAADAAGITLGATLAFSGSALQTGAGSGDVSWSANSFATTLATVNSDVGACGSPTSIPTVTLNAKGLATACSGNAIVAPAGTLSGTTLNATVVTSSLTSLGTVAAGVWQGTAVAIAYGGSGQATALAARGSAGFNIEACTSTGDANGTIASTDRCYYHTALSAPRTDTLPLANSVNAGGTIVINDFRGVASGVNTITAARAGADTINGSSSSVVVSAQYGIAVLMSDGATRWTVLTPGSGGGGGGVSAVTAGNGLDGGTITTSGTISVRYARQFMLPL